jgi:di/tripeptidase
MLWLGSQVTEKNSSSQHNFLEDPISLVREGEWLKVGCLPETADLSCNGLQ